MLDHRTKITASAVKAWHSLVTIEKLTYQSISYFYVKDNSITRSWSRLGGGNKG